MALQQDRRSRRRGAARDGGRLNGEGSENRSQEACASGRDAAARRGPDAPIVGLALTGIEGTVVEEFIAYREAARRLGLGFTVHAGEMGPPGSIVEALDLLDADRIDHGVAAIRDPELLERLVRDQVVLDLCPSSNAGTGAFPPLEAHPVAAFWRAGVNLTISSDDPPLVNTTRGSATLRVLRSTSVVAACPCS